METRLYNKSKSSRLRSCEREDPIKNKKRKKVLIIVTALVLIMAGASLVYLSSRSKWEENSVQKQLRAIYSSQLASGQPDIDPDGQGEIGPEGTIPAPLETVPAVLPDDQEEADEPFDISRLKPMAILKIPKIKIEAVMVEGVTPNDLRYAVGHFPGTGLPGQAGNLAIAGHRNFITGDFFGHLDKVGLNDQLIVEYGYDTFVYKVTEIFVVEPDETWVLNPSREAQITLVTCTPPRISSHRLIVRGVLQEG